MAAAETARLVAELSLKDKMTPALKKAGSSLSSFDKATSNTQKSLSKFGKNIGKGIAIGAGAIAAGGVIVVKAAADYEQAFAGVRKTVDATEPQLQKLSDGFRQMAKEIPISASELAALGEAGGALGIAATDLEEFVRVTALLGQTTNITAEDAATSLGVLSNVLHLTSDEYSKFASALVALGNAGASTEADIISIAERAGAAGELIGVSTEGVLAFSSSIASLGIEAEAGGTALQRLFIKSAEAVAEGGKGLKTYAKVAGKSAKDFKKAFEKDAGGALQDFLAGLGKLTQGEQIAVLKDLGLSGANLTRVLLGLGNNAELLGSQIDVANTAFEENTALTKEAAERNKTFSSQMQITKNVLNDIAITIGSKLLPKLVPLLQQFNKFVSENQGQIEKFGDDLATAFSDIATAVGKTDWTPFIDGLRLSAELAKGAFNAFNALPDDFKKLILVGAGVNKITGGLLTSIGKDALKIGFEQFAGKGSSPANPLWVQSVGGVGGVGPGGVGGSGIVGKVAAATVIAAPAVVIAELQPEINRAILGDNVLTSPSKWLPPADDPKPFWELLGNNTSKANEHMSSLIAASDRTKDDTVAAIGGAQKREAAEVVALKNTLNTTSQRQVSAQDSIKTAVAALQSRVTHSGQQTAAAIKDKDLSVKLYNSVTVSTSVSVRSNITAHNNYKSVYRVAE